MKLFVLLSRTWRSWNADHAPRLGAALAYYTIFSLAPLLLVVTAVAGLVLGEDAARGSLLQELQKVMGPQAAQAIQAILLSAHQPQGGYLATAVGLVIVLLGAAGFFGQLQDALNTIWAVPPSPHTGWTRMLRSRFLSFLMVLGTGFLLLTSLVLSAAIAAAGQLLQNALPVPEFVLQMLTFGIALGIETLLFVMIYKVLPDVILRWRDVLVGGLMTALLFELGKTALALYIGKSGVGSTFGAAGSLVALLLWIYYAAQILFFGAEFTKVWVEAHEGIRFPHQPLPPRLADTRPAGHPDQPALRRIRREMEHRVPRRERALDAASIGAGFFLVIVAKSGWGMLVSRCHRSHTMQGPSP